MPNIKALKARAHALNPVVMIGNKGLTDAVLLEIEAALETHELIKVKIAAARDERSVIAQKIAEATEADLIQTIGQMAIFFRPSES